MEKAARTIQKTFRRRRVFTEPWGISNSFSKVRFSKTTIASTVSIVKTHVDLDEIFTKEPKGFTEVLGYRDLRHKPHVRYTTNRGWIGTVNEPKYVLAKRGAMTVTLSTDELKVSGSGNYEEAWRLCVQNGWVPRNLLNKEPQFKIINVKFNLNKSVNLYTLAEDINKRVPRTVFSERVEFTYDPTMAATFPSLTLKMVQPKLTFQIFENGTVLCSGIHKLKDLEVPKQTFVNLFKTYNLYYPDIFSEESFVKLPGRNSNTRVKGKLAMRYPLAGTWENLMTPVPDGYYIRPGTDGRPRLYVYQYYRKLVEGPYVIDKTVDLAGVAPKVVKAFEKVGKPIPESTREIFRKAGHPLEKYETAEPKKRAAPKNRRAPSWNAVDPSGKTYVRPGTGQQPYWFAVPKDIKAGRKTVVTSYTKAGRNIPAKVREIFQIPANVKTNTGPTSHVVTMGLDRILRIDNRQATRLTKKELIEIARNMNIAQVNAAMDPATIVEYIRSKAGVSKVPSRAFDAEINGTKYLLRNNKRVEKTKGAQRTVRNWNLIPAAEQNMIAKKILPAELHVNYNALPASNRYDALLAMKKGFISSPTSSSASSNGSLVRMLEAAFE